MSTLEEFLTEEARKLVGEEKSPSGFETTEAGRDFLNSFGATPESFDAGQAFLDSFKASQDSAGVAAQMGVAPSPVEANVVPAQAQSFLLEVLDYLQAGTYISAGVVQGLLDGRSDLAAAAWENLTNEDKITFVDILRQHNVPMAFIIGTALDIGLDPLTYMGPVFKFMNLRKAVNWAKSTSLGLRAHNYMKRTSIVNLFGDAFKPDWKVPKELRDMVHFAQAELTHLQRTTVGEIVEWFDNIPLETRKIMSAVREDPTVVHRFTPSEQAAFDKVASRLDILGRDAVENKLITEAAYAEFANTYLPHYYPKVMELKGRVVGDWFTPTFTMPRKFKSLSEAREYVTRLEPLTHQKTVGDAMRYASENGLNAISLRSHLDEAGRQGLTELEVIKRWADVRIARATPEEDIMKLLSFTEIERMRIKSSLALWDGILNNPAFATVVKKGGVALPNDVMYIPRSQLGWLQDVKLRQNPQIAAEIDRLILAADDAGENMLKIDSTIGQQLVELTTSAPIYSVDEEIMGAVRRMQAVIRGENETEPLFAIMTNITNWWKRWMTVGRLPWQVRNAYSNLELVYLSGVSPLQFPKFGKEAMQVLLKSDSISPYIVRGKQLSYRELDDELRRLGVISFGGVEFELSQDALKSLGTVLDPNATSEQVSAARKAWESITSGFGVMDRMTQFASGVEYHARVMAALGAMSRKGVGANLDEVALREAANIAGSFLFQYHELTDTERVIKKFVPFYTWFRKNFGLMVDTIYSHPEKFHRIGKFDMALEKMIPWTQEEYDFFPSWMLQQGYVKWAYPDNEGNSVFYSLDLPHKDFEQLAYGIDLVNQLHYGKVILELGLNVESFPEATTLSQFNEGGGVQDLVQAPSYVAFLPEIIQNAMGAQPYRDKRSGQWTLGIPPGIEKVLQVAPILRDVRLAFPETPGTFQAENQPWRRISYLTGIQVRPLNVEEERLWYAIEQNDRLYSIRQWMMDTGQKPTPELMRSILQERR